MGITERHWFENEEPELTERQLEDAVREQAEAYQSGYIKGYSDRDKKIVRCKDCKHRDPEDGKCDSGHTIQWQLSRPDDWFCADGEK